MRDLALVILARAPVPGRAKTRLAAAIGQRRAHHVYRELLAITASAVAGWGGPVLLAGSGDRSAFRGTGLERLPWREQLQATLGHRIAAALTWGFGMASRSLVLGSDCPGVVPSDLVAMGTALDSAPVVLGPADDGGFWAIAAADPAVAMAIASAEIPWSDSETMSALRLHLASSGFPSRLGPAHFDCDTAADLDRAVAAGLLSPFLRVRGPGRAPEPMIPRGHGANGPQSPAARRSARREA